MKIIQILLMLCACIFGNSSYGNGTLNAAQKQNNVDQSASVPTIYADALKRAENNEPAGLLKLYEIAGDDGTYTAEYSEAAYDELSLLLYSRTALWVRTFARVDKDKFRKFFNGINDAQLPKGITSSEQFAEGILSRLNKIKGDKKEADLVSYLKTLLSHYRHQQSN